MNAVRALIVDDSAMMRSRLRTILTRDVGVEIVGVAYDAMMALDRIRRLRPQVVVLNAEDPHGQGLSFLATIRQADPVPVVVVSAYARPTPAVCRQALALGASDVIDAALLDTATDANAAAQALLVAVQRAGRARPAGRPATRSAIESANDGGMAPAVIAIGASTGGTEALRELVAGLPAEIPGIVVAQHMAPTFTRAFADRLDRTGLLRVLEGYDGAVVKPGHLLVAPGGRHTTVVADGDRFVLRTHDTPPVNQHRPSIDVLFESCAAVVGARAIGVLLTGMGADGADGLATMRLTGAHTIAQDEATSVVFGMPREAIARGGAVEILALHEIAPALVQRSRPLRSA